MLLTMPLGLGLDSAVWWCCFAVLEQALFLLFYLCSWSSGFPTLLVSSCCRRSSTLTDPSPVSLSRWRAGRNGVLPDLCSMKCSLKYFTDIRKILGMGSFCRNRDKLRGSQVYRFPNARALRITYWLHSLTVVVTVCYSY